MQPLLQIAQFVHALESICTVPKATVTVGCLRIAGLCVATGKASTNWDQPACWFPSQTSSAFMRRGQELLLAKWLLHTLPLKGRQGRNPHGSGGTCQTLCWLFTWLTEHLWLQEVREIALHIEAGEFLNLRVFEFYRFLSSQRETSLGMTGRGWAAELKRLSCLG